MHLYSHTHAHIHIFIWTNRLCHRMVANAFARKRKLRKRTHVEIDSKRYCYKTMSVWSLLNQGILALFFYNGRKTLLSELARKRKEEIWTVIGRLSYHAWYGGRFVCFSANVQGWGKGSPAVSFYAAKSWNNGELFLWLLWIYWHIPRPYNVARVQGRETRIYHWFRRIHSDMCACRDSHE